jgi:copper chaperone CopZ
MQKVIIVTTIYLLISLTTAGQFKTANIGIDGLTCSMCSYSVERSIKKLGFVERVAVDLNTNIATVVFKTDVKTNIRDLIKSVANAGFSVHSLSAQFNFPTSVKVTDSFFYFDDQTFIILDPKSNEMFRGPVEIKFIEKKFSESKLYKKYKSVIDKSSPDDFTNQSYHIVI